MKIHILFAWALFGIVASAQTTRVQIDTAHTRVMWTLGAALHTVHGTFQVKSADVWLELTSGKAGGSIIVDARSGESGSGARDARMHRNVLQSSQFPDITLVPDRIDGAINMQGDSDQTLHGAFTIHGATHEITIPLHTHVVQGKVTATMKFSVPYVEWGMKNPSTVFLKVKDTVEIEIETSGEFTNHG